MAECLDSLLHDDEYAFQCSRECFSGTRGQADPESNCIAGLGSIDYNRSPAEVNSVHGKAYDPILIFVLELIQRDLLFDIDFRKPVSMDDIVLPFRTIWNISVSRVNGDKPACMRAQPTSFDVRIPFMKAVCFPV